MRHPATHGASGPSPTSHTSPPAHQTYIFHPQELPAVLSEIADTVKVIDASNNRITALPAFLPTLANLQRLTLSGNLLTVLLPPGACAGLTSLKV